MLAAAAAVKIYYLCGMGKSFKIKWIIIAAVMLMAAGSGFSAVDKQTLPEVSFSECLAQEHAVLFDSPQSSDFALHESSFSVVNNGPSSGSARQWDSFRAVLKASEVAVHLVLTKTISEVLNFPVRIRKADLLYPFHYFF